jgi:hypothetical protein
LIIFAQQYPPLPKLPLVKLSSKQLLQVLDLNDWGVGSVHRDGTSQMEKNKNLQEMI